MQIQPNVALSIDDLASLTIMVRDQLSATRKKAAEQRDAGNEYAAQSYDKMAGEYGGLLVKLQNPL